MKYGKSLRALAVLGSLISAAAAFAGTGKTVTLGIDGMTCGSCAKKIEKQVNSLKSKGVESCKVDLGAQTASVSLKDGATVTAQDLKAAVEKAGYEAKTVTGI